MSHYAALHEFNPAGMDLFKRVFTGQPDDTAIDPIDAHLASRVEGSGPFAPAEFRTAREMAQSVLDSFGSNSLSDLLHNSGLWGWLTFVMRDQLFGRAHDGTWKVGEIHRWYPGSPNDWRKSQRHLVRMPVLLRESLGECADHLLCGAPSLLPEIREQLTSQQDMFNATFQQVARSLYFDDDTSALKRGAGGKGAGTPRRLARVRQQLDVTWDLEELPPNRIIEMLPAEFSRFKPTANA